MKVRRYPFIVQLISMFAGTILLFLAVLGYALYSYTNITALTVGYSNSVNHSTTELVMLKDGHTNFTRALLNMRGFLFYPDGAVQYEQGYRDYFKSSYDMIKSYNVKAQPPNPEAQQLEAWLAEYQEIGNKVIAAKKNNDPNLNQIVSAGRQLVDKIDTQFVAVAKNQSSVINADSEQLIDQSQKQNKIIIIVSIGVTLLVMLLAVRYSRSIAMRLKNLRQELSAISSLDLTHKDVHATRNDEIGDMAEAIIAMKQSLREIVSRLDNSATTLATSSEELAASSGQAAQGANQVAASITEISAGAAAQSSAANEAAAKVEQLSDGMQRVAVNINQVAAQSSQTADQAQSGDVVIVTAVGQMNSVEELTQLTATAIGKLNEKSNAISQIVDTIAGIAGQTNLLALNAAIEAARAGAAGRGFAVVAEEVRKLAEQAHAAAQKITDLIHEIQGDTANVVQITEQGAQEIQKGAAMVDTAGQAFREIRSLITAVSQQVQEVSLEMQQISAGSQDIVASVKTMDEHNKKSAAESQNVSAATQEQLASMEEMAAAGKTLAHLAQDLQVIVGSFQK